MTDVESALRQKIATLQIALGLAVVVIIVLFFVAMNSARNVAVDAAKDGMAIGYCAGYNEATSGKPARPEMRQQADEALKKYHFTP
jgi:hypothetical protein